MIVSSGFPLRTSAGDGNEVELSRGAVTWETRVQRYGVKRLSA